MTDAAGGERAERAIAAIVEVLSRRGEVYRVVLFGSRARRDHRSRSDIDLAVDAAGASARQWQEIEEIIDDAPTLLPIDLVARSARRAGVASPSLRSKLPTRSPWPGASPIHAGSIAGRAFTTSRAGPIMT
jgi:predicted nucleotidyltransferase